MVLTDNITQSKIDLIKWMVGFWLTQMAVLLGLYLRCCWAGPASGWGGNYIEAFPRDVFTWFIPYRELRPLVRPGTPLARMLAARGMLVR